METPMTTIELARKELVVFLGTIVRPGQRIDDVDDNTNLIDAGLIDSLALVQIITYLEDNFGLSLNAGNVDPNDLGSIAGMLRAIELASR